MQHAPTVALPVTLPRPRRHPPPPNLQPPARLSRVLLLLLQDHLRLLRKPKPQEAELTPNLLRQRTHDRVRTSIMPQGDRWDSIYNL